jgi:hypothetical protein
MLNIMPPIGFYITAFHPISMGGIEFGVISSPACRQAGSSEKDKIVKKIVSFKL